jgi:prophage regulatory protein
MTADNLLRMPDVERKTGLDRATLYRRIKAGDFPQPVQLGARRVAWRESEIAQWQGGLAVGVRRESAPA